MPTEKAVRPSKERLEEIRKTIEVTLLEGTQFFPQNWEDILDLLNEIDYLEDSFLDMEVVRKNTYMHLLAAEERIEKLREALGVLKAGLEFPGVPATPGTLFCLKALSDDDEAAK